MLQSPRGFSSIEAVLAGCIVALPESREIDVLAGLLERRGAQVIRCPLVSIIDTPETAEVEAWIRRFVANPPAYFILLTGEGMRRLFGFAGRIGLLEAFESALRRTTILARGPKPGRALRDHGIEVDLRAAEPTTEGVIATLETLELEGRHVEVQLYGDNPNLRLMDYLADRESRAGSVAPYRYAPKTHDLQVLQLQDALAEGRVDAMVFTSKAQVQRLFKVAQEHGRIDALLASLARVVVAAVGPVVADELADHGVATQVMPEDRYFMKPLVAALAEHLDCTARVASL